MKDYISVLKSKPKIKKAGDLGYVKTLFHPQYMKSEREGKS